MNASARRVASAPAHADGFVPAARRAIAFCLPIFVGLVLQSLNGAINAMFVGHGLGPAALAATSNANGVLLLVAGIVSGFGIAANVAVARCVGSGDRLRARHVAANATALVVAVALAVAATGALTSAAIVDLLGVPAASRAAATTYLALMFIGAPFVHIAAFLGMLVRAHGDARTPFVFLAIAVVLDVALNPLLIFGAGPLPSLGVAGSALATIVAQVVALAAFLVSLRRRRAFAAAAGAPPSRLDRTVLVPLAAKGLALGLQPVVVAAGTLGLLAIANRRGVDVVAALGACAQLWTYLQMPALALGIGIASLAAQEVGAGRRERVAQLAASGVAVAILATAVPVAAAYAFDRQVLGLFLAEDGAAMRLARHGNAIAAWSFVVFGASFVLIGVVRSTGAVVAPLAILAVALLGLRLPFAFAFDANGDAIWWSVPLGLVAAAILTAAYYRYGRWRAAT